MSILPGSVIAKNGITLEAPNIPSKAAWQALVCTLSGCELRSVRLRIEGAKPLGIDKNAEPSASVHVSIVRTRRSKPGEMTVALIAGLPGAGKQVDTYFTTRTPRNSLDATTGSIGIAFNMPNAGLCRILPRWNNKAADPFMTLYVEQGTQRQPVGKIPLEVLNRGFKTRDILVWAGDIDGDGKVDLITRNTPDSYGVVGKRGSAALSTGLNLWLSTKAESGNMVGLAASLDSWEDVVEENEGC